MADGGMRPEIKAIWSPVLGPSCGPDHDLRRVVAEIAAVLDGILGRLDALEARLDRPPQERRNRDGGSDG